jgi:hypothetical protein
MGFGITAARATPNAEQRDDDHDQTTNSRRPAGKQKIGFALRAAAHGTAPMPSPA